MTWEIKLRSSVNNTGHSIPLATFQITYTIPEPPQLILKKLDIENDLEIEIQKGYITNGIKKASKDFPMPIWGWYQNNNNLPTLEHDCLC